jgi:hypothetical protein
MREIPWDGKNLAVIQMAFVNHPREQGRTAYEVDENWNLTVYGELVPVGSVIEVPCPPWGAEA